MTRALERAELTAELSEVESMLGELPNDWIIERAGLEGRAQEIRQRLAELSGSVARGAEAALYFGGGPVIGTIGVDAAFGGGAIERFQDLVGAVQHSTGPDKDRQHGRGLQVTAALHGSFGFQLQELDPPLLDASDLAVAVDTAVQIVRGAKSTDGHELEELVATSGTRVYTKLRQFIGHLAEHGAAMRVVAEHARVDFSREEIADAATRLNAAEMQEETVEVEGVFGGELSFTRRFDVKADTGRVISGVIPRQIAPEAFDIWHHKRCIVVMKVLTRIVGNQRRSVYTLKDIMPPTDPGTEPLPK